MIALDKLEKFITMVADSRLAEVSITDGESRLSVVNAVQSLKSTAQTAASHAPLTAQPSQPQADPSHIITATAVGRLCLEGIDLKVGDSVAVGEVVAGVQALGVLTPITADKAGVVRELMMADKAQVQWGQPLLVLELH
ncbi:MAG: biotin/lipoyl-containing protein [Moraxella sp.]|nr:biotin/lipoyl-containing protein [Moraxella sp.]